MTKVIIFNGPPRSGKDTVAGVVTGLLSERGYPTSIIKFAEPMKDAMAAMFDLDSVQFKKYFESPEKDKPQAKFFGKTPREVLISFSETWAKIVFGNEVFGLLAGVKISDNETEQDIFVITDCGFDEELMGMFKYVGPKNCVIYRLERENTDYRKDSRNWILNDDVLYNKKLDNNRDVWLVAREVVKDLEINSLIKEEPNNDDEIPF